jgi:hypothetical protein
MAINMFGRNKGVVLESHARGSCVYRVIQEDRSVSMLGGGSIGSCEIKCSCELCLIMNG